MTIEEYIILKKRNYELKEKMRTTRKIKVISSKSSGNNNNKQKKNKKDDNRFKPDWLKIIATLLILVGLFFVGLEIYEVHKIERESSGNMIVKYDDEKEGQPQITDNLMKDRGLDKLLEKNSDVYGWLYVPNTNINSYVMQEQEINKYYYERHTIDKKYLQSGSYFVPKYDNTTDFTNAVTQIMGHNMGSWWKEEVAFSTILKKYETKKMAEERRFAYTYQKGHNIEWQLAMYVNVNAYEDIYLKPFEKGSVAYREVIKEIKERARYSFDDVNLTENDDVLILSTCTVPNRYGGDGRTILVFKKVREHKY